MAGTLRRRLHDWALVWTRPREPEALPARFDRRRVYVLPTRFGLFYAVLLLAMLLGALNYNNNPALLLGLLLAGAGLASLVAAQLQLTGLAVVALDAEPVPAGDELTVRLHAQADDRRRRRGLAVALESTEGASHQRTRVARPAAVARVDHPAARARHRVGVRVAAGTGAGLSTAGTGRPAAADRLG